MSEPTFYDDIEATRVEALRLLTTGVENRRSPFHTPTLATIGADDRHPRMRTVVLRAFDATGPSLRFHTDLRSQKVFEIRANPDVALHIYDPAAKVQIRLGGMATLHAEDDVAEAAWAGSRVMSRQCYGAEPGPGSTIPSGNAFTLPDATDEATEIGREHFCAVVVSVSSLEWLYLAMRGHRRALFLQAEDGWTSRWLAP